MSRRGAYRYTIKTKEGQPPINLDTKEAVIDWMTKHSTDYSIITPLCDRFDKATGVLASQWCKGQKQFLVQWAPTPYRFRHIPLHTVLGYKIHCTAPNMGNQLDDAGEKTCLVTWEPVHTHRWAHWPYHVPGWKIERGGVKPNPCYHDAKSEHCLLLS